MIPYVGLRSSFENNDFGYLQRALDLYARVQALFHSVMAGGTDHSGLMHGALLGLAAADDELLKTLMPHELGVAKEGHPLNVCCSNMLMGLCYKDDSLVEEGKKRAARWLKTKRTKSATGVARYMLALVDDNADDASEALELINQGIPKEKEPLVRFAPVEFSYYLTPLLHGLYNVAFYGAGKAFQEKIVVPDRCFSHDYARYLSECSYSEQAEPFYMFTDEARILNHVLSSIPATRLESPSDGSSYQDVNTCTTSLIESLNSMLDEGLEDFYYRYHSFHKK